MAPNTDVMMPTCAATVTPLPFKQHEKEDTEDTSSISAFENSDGEPDKKCNVCPPEAVQQNIDSLCNDSRFFTKQDCSSVLSKTLSVRDLDVSEELGKGGFCLVQSCTWQGSEYALKQAKPTPKADPEVFRQNSANLLNEAMFLQQVHHHENIINLYNLTYNEDNISHGLLLEKVDTVLDKQISEWRDQLKASPLIFRLGKQHKKKKKTMFNERLEIVLQIANVMEYLHSMNLVFRDLKPDNVGLAYNNGNSSKATVKLLDFGLCREVKDSEANLHGVYQMTGNTGGTRYMAPEVALGRPYNNKVDAYSFAILLWETMSLEPPFRKYCESKQMKRVVIGGERLEISDSWPPELRKLIRQCWSPNPNIRPAFSDIASALEALVSKEMKKRDP